MTQLFSTIGIWTVGSVLVVSTASFTGLLFLSLSERILQKLLLPFVSFATGAMLGNVFVHILPEVIHDTGNLPQSLLLVLGGMLLSFVIEKFIHWHHCHHLECEHHANPAGRMVLIGESAHIRLGIATTFAVILHEIPQEIGNFSVLVHSGFTPLKALGLNFLSALAAVVGAIAVLIVSGPLGHIELILLPIAAGNFLYIAGADLIPELHKESRVIQGLIQFLCILGGTGLMLVLSTVVKI